MSPIPTPQEDLPPRSDDNYLSESLMQFVLRNDFDSAKGILSEHPETAGYYSPFHHTTALHLAAGMGNLRLVQAITASQFCNATTKDGQGRQPVDLALRIGHEEIVDILLSRMALIANTTGADEPSPPSN